MRSLICCIAAASSVMLGGCTRRAIAEPEVRFETVPVPVAVPCVVGRPAEPISLNKRIPSTEWAKRAPGAKAQAVAAQAGERMNFSDRLAAATSGCAERR